MTPEMADRYNFNDQYEPSNAGLSLSVLFPVAVVLISVFLFLGVTSLVNFPEEPPASAEAAPMSEEVPLLPERQQTRGSILSPVFTKEVQHWASQIAGWADEWNLDPDLVATVMQIESCGDPQALSSAGAAGLFQVMPYHFKEGEDAYHPDTNAKRGLAYLVASLKDKDKDIRLALAGYNGGINGARRPESEWPSQTRRYVYWGMGIYEDAISGKDTSPRLEEWLNAGGASLCRQAARRLGLTP